MGAVAYLPGQNFGDAAVGDPQLPRNITGPDSVVG
jgi:hypothetical protein